MTQTFIDRIAGVCHIMITPFDSNQEVDHAGVTAVVADAASAGATAVIPLGIMGESHRMLDQERRAVLDSVVAAARPGSLAVIAGITSESTYVAIKRTEDAANAGADAVMMAPPRGTTAGPALLAHYRAVAEATHLPVVVQDEPVTTGVKLPGPFFAELAAVDGIVAAKVEEVPSPQKISAIKQAAPDLACFGGLGGVSFYEELNRGAVGIMTGFGYPKILVDIYQAFTAGDTARARAIFHQYLPIIRFEAQLGVGGVTIRKGLYRERGIIADPAVRLPAPALDEATLGELRELVDVLELNK